LPVYWGANQKGMQAGGELEGQALADAQVHWLEARDAMLRRSANLAELGLHKQLCNRLVEPWMFITIVLTATEWDNAWALRVDPAAQPEMERAFHLAHDLYTKSEPQKLERGQWHLPYVTGFDEATMRMENSSSGDNVENSLCVVSAGRCAAVSYLNQDKRSPAADALRAEKLLDNGHMSPFEHVAQAMTQSEWIAESTLAASRWTLDRIPLGNLWGWRQYRKMLKHEHDFSKIKHSPA
jgi:hypothetical protein